MASAVPVRVGATTLVRRSLLLDPLSDPAASARPVGTPGAVVSMVTVRPADAVELLPATSTAIAVSVWSPLPSVVLVIDHTPLPLAVPVPATAVPS